MRPLRLGRLAWEARTSGHPNWRSILRASNAESRLRMSAGASGPRVMFATSLGIHFGVTRLDSLLAAALKLRGAETSVLLCDAALAACMAADMSWYGSLQEFSEKGLHPGVCRSCFAPAADMFESLGVTVLRYSSFLDAARMHEIDRLSASLALEDIKSYKVGGVAVGEHAWAGTLRFLARGTLVPALGHDDVLRRYFKAALTTEAVAREAFRRHAPDVVVAHHGIYVPQGIVAHVARELGIRVVTWNPAYRQGCFIFSHADTYHHTMMSEPVSAWKNLSLDGRQTASIVSYLQSRMEGSGDWISFLKEAESDKAAIEAELGIDLAKPSVGLLTNVFWDAQLHYPANAFPSMREWIVETISYFAAHPELQLIVRIHPAEITGFVPSRERVADMIAESFPQLPPNIFIVPPESSASTYVLMAHCKAAIIYGTKMGVELSTWGMPIICAGEAWIRGKGLSLDAVDRASYFQLLDSLGDIMPMDAAAIARAKRYAYHFFFRRMIPLPMLKPIPRWPLYEVADLELSALIEGHHPGLDVICKGILSGADFIYPAEQYV